MIRFPRRRTPAQRRGAELAAAATLGTALGNALRERPFLVEHKHTYGARPPLPKPARMRIEWELQDGSRLQSYVDLHGQRYTAIPWPSYLDPTRYKNPTLWPPVAIHFNFEYDER